ncbi:hypothetical protein CCZ01_10065, partial [Helicobacter monodelphidis]|uniref:hypothetical protein n=1 Tax=Helicobacter sp. 15-1451 TaxID=2004995 RepID=UPI000DCC9783
MEFLEMSLSELEEWSERRLQESRIYRQEAEREAEEARIYRQEAERRADQAEREADQAERKLEAYILKVLRESNNEESLKIAQELEQSRIYRDQAEREA